MQAGFISVMGFWVGGYGAFEATTLPDPAPIYIDGLSLAPDIQIDIDLNPDVFVTMSLSPNNSWVGA